MKKAVRNIQTVLKALVAGVIGAAIFFLFGVIGIALTKVIFALAQKSMYVSNYLIGTVMVLFILCGFFYGIASFIKKNTNYKIFQLKWSTVAIDALLSIVFTTIIYFTLKNVFNINIKGAFIGLFLICLVLTYAFSAIFVKIYNARTKTPRKAKVGAGTWCAAIILNPIFVIGFFALFSMVVYDSTYQPCGVYFERVDQNVYTANTKNLDIEPGEKIVSIDGVSIASLEDVRSYMDSLDSTKQVVLETEEHIYYVNTYKVGERRVMGLILQERICKKA